MNEIRNCLPTKKKWLLFNFVIVTLRSSIRAAYGRQALTDYHTAREADLAT
jgi:hypothetical protein